jgi:hypothetical protein
LAFAFVGTARGLGCELQRAAERLVEQGFLQFVEGGEFHALAGFEAGYFLSQRIAVLN